MLDLLRHRRAWLASASGKVLRPLQVVLFASALALIAADRSAVAAQEAGDTETPSATSDDVPPIEPVEDKEAYFPGVVPFELEAIRDNTDFLPSEADAWYHLLAVLQKTEPGALAKASLGKVEAIELDRQPMKYRGRLVTLDGVVRRAKWVKAPENAYGINGYFQLWLQPAASEPPFVVIYSLQTPPEFPQGKTIAADVSATGFFYKRWSYKSAAGDLNAPVLLARTIDWQQPAAEQSLLTRLPLDPISLALLAGFLVSLLLFVVIALFGWRRKRAEDAETRARREAKFAATLAAIEGGEPAVELEPSEETVDADELGGYRDN